LSAGVQLIVGLGNPGNEYEQTRHNAGYWFVDAVARQYCTSFKSEKKFHGDVARITINGQEVWLLKPDTFMNRSGQAIQALASFYKIKLENILVAHDELDLDPGVIRLKKEGGHGGHNGLRDTIEKMGGKNFLRLRIGIGHPGDKNKVSGYVLKKASSDDQTDIVCALEQALKVLPQVIEGDLQKAMNELHSSC
jgi:PTH1 family peptidyl-tRNA hydrolase